MRPCRALVTHGCQKDTDDPSGFCLDHRPKAERIADALKSAWADLQSELPVISELSKVLPADQWKASVLFSALSPAGKKYVAASLKDFPDVLDELQKAAVRH